MIDFAKNYISNLSNLLKDIDVEKIDIIMKELKSCAKKKSKVYVLGNGGSAATASHIVNDLGVGLNRRNILGLDIQSLADNTPVLTAIANDIGYENIFYSQLEGSLNQDDLVMAISCSGNSKNIIKAVNYSKDIGAKVIGITGFDGGKLKELADINFHVQTEKNNYGLVEDIHLILDHIIYSYFIKEKSINEK